MKDARFFDANNEPLPRRIATGLQKVALALRHEAQLAAQGRGRSPLQDQILVLLLNESGTGTNVGLRPGELALRLAVKAPTVSDALKVLEQKGLVQRSPMPDDARATLVELSARGRKEAAKAGTWPDFLASAVDALDEAEQVVFLGGVVKMIGALQDAGRIPVSRMCTSCDFFRAAVHRDPARPHHCAYVDAALGPADYRLDCDEHVAADPVRRAQNSLLLQTGG